MKQERWEAEMSEDKGLWSGGTAKSRNWHEKAKGDAVSRYKKASKKPAEPAGSGGSIPLKIVTPPPPLEILMNHVSNSVSAAALSDSSTKNLNLSEVFRKAFAPTPFRKSVSDMTPALVSEKIISLVKGVFQTATAAQTMDTPRKSDLFLSLLDSMGKGFQSAEKIIQTLEMMDGKVKQALDGTRRMIRQNLGTFYSSILAEEPLPETPPAEDAAVPAEAPAAPEPVKAPAPEVPAGPPAAADNVRAVPLSTFTLPEAQSTAAAPRESDEGAARFKADHWRRFHRLMAYSRQLMITPPK